jgi:two-component system response regulator NreC
VIKVLIVDDHAVVRAGLRALIHDEPELNLVGEATGGVEAVEMARQLVPDIVLLDISMPDLDGIQVTRQLRQAESPARILILTVHEDEGLLREALKAGASGYILKKAAESELISAVHVVMRGDLFVDPAMMRSLLGEGAQVESTLAKVGIEPLTRREVDVLKLIVQGYTNRQIAEELCISTRTVEGHRSNLSDKLGLHTRVELVRYAKEHSLIE